MILCVVIKHLPKKIESSFPGPLLRLKRLICPRRSFVAELGCDFMKKNIYGIIDMKTGNFGDLCILDRDEEFRDGCIKLFCDSDVPDYVVRDLMAVRYGTISYDPDSLYPKIDLEPFPRMVISGAAAVAKLDVSRKTSSESSSSAYDEDLHLAESRYFSDLDSGPADFPDDDIAPVPAEEVII